MQYVPVVASRSGGNAVTEPRIYTTIPGLSTALRSPDMLLRSLWSKLRPGIPMIGMYHAFGDLKPPMSDLDVADLRITHFGAFWAFV